MILVMSACLIGVANAVRELVKERAIYTRERAAGLSPRHVEVLSRCTACEPETFFSHRRDAGRTGRQVGFILGPALGGIVYILSAGATYAACAACYFLAFLACLAIIAPKAAARRVCQARSSPPVRFIAALTMNTSFFNRPTPSSRSRRIGESAAAAPT